MRLRSLRFQNFHVAFLSSSYSSGGSSSTYVQNDSSPVISYKATTVLFDGDAASSLCDLMLLCIVAAAICSDLYEKIGAAAVHDLTCNLFVVIVGLAVVLVLLIPVLLEHDVLPLFLLNQPKFVMVASSPDSLHRLHRLRVSSDDVDHGDNDSDRDALQSDTIHPFRSVPSFFLCCWSSSSFLHPKSSAVEARCVLACASHVGHH
eukprot:CAMPEP_0198131280 /NCGR_PEP_ID=MMETSP1442-20131203/55816_1 /TAXON_ID= /ORGANISM="Craspedostauros australis, Strain CCMP3328" /LENGTH=204 /DNA_ID=CAMNT_0043792055 /DNA_START=232 /DNA_END=845 /DNA_ORIENTATION=-